MMAKTEYTNPWIFDGRKFDTEDVGKAEGFVYLITNITNGRVYIGRKYFWQIRKVKNKKNRQRSESDWKNYYGSSGTVKEDIDVLGKENFAREILSIHQTRGDCNRTEVELQWKLNVLYDSEWYNDAIGNYKTTTKRVMDGRIVSVYAKLLLGDNV